MTKDKEQSGISRRSFVGRSAAAAAGITILPSYVISGLGHTPPSDRLNIAGIGIGGMGFANLKNIVNKEDPNPANNVVALCDVDWKYAGRVFNYYPEAKKYKDFRNYAPMAVKRRGCR